MVGAKRTVVFKNYVFGASPKSLRLVEDSALLVGRKLLDVYNSSDV